MGVDVPIFVTNLAAGLLLQTQDRTTYVTYSIAPHFSVGNTYIFHRKSMKIPISDHKRAYWITCRPSPMPCTDHKGWKLEHRLQTNSGDLLRSRTTPHWSSEKRWEVLTDRWRYTLERGRTSLEQQTVQRISKCQDFNRKDRIQKGKFPSTPSQQVRLYITSPILRPSFPPLSPSKIYQKYTPWKPYQQDRDERYELNIFSWQPMQTMRRFVKVVRSSYNTTQEKA